MGKKYDKIRSIIFPNKKINIFVISILFLGVIAGSVFVNVIGIDDKNLVIEKIKTFIDNINDNSINTFVVFKNSISINFTYSIIIWVLGMTFLGVIFNVCLLFVKGFIFGFSLASFIVSYGFKGLPLSIIYLLFGQIFSILAIIVLVIYSIIFTINLLKIIIKGSNIKTSHFFKHYLIIFIMVLIIDIIASLCESFMLPALVKLIIKLY